MWEGHIAPPTCGHSGCAVFAYLSARERYSTPSNWWSTFWPTGSACPPPGRLASPGSSVPAFSAAPGVSGVSAAPGASALDSLAPGASGVVWSPC